MHVRIARSTDRLPEIVAFYRDVLGLEILSQFQGHDGFDGVMVGRRGSDMHFEFTHEQGAGDHARPSPDDLVVFYLDEIAWTRVVRAIEATGAPTVRSHNPYWDRRGITVEDPDGYRVVVHRGLWRP